MAAANPSDDLMEELFGVSDDDEPQKQPAANEAQEEALEDDADEPVQQKNRAGRRRATGEPLHVELPVPAAPIGSAETMMMRLSNIVTVKHRPFDPESHTVEGELIKDEKGVDQFKPFDLNVIRWRIGRNELGEDTVESNARLVRFSDGSVQLEIGDEVLKVGEADVSKDNDHLFVAHGGGLLECKAQLRKKLTCRPSSLNSKSHRLLTTHVDKKHVKVTRTKTTVTTFDPEIELERRMKEIQKDEKNNRALERKQNAIKTRGERGAPPSPQQGGASGLTSGFLEGGAERNDRGGPKKGGAGKGGYGRAQARDEDSDESGGSDGSYSESEEEREEKKRKRKKAEPANKQKKEKTRATKQVISSDSDS